MTYVRDGVVLSLVLAGALLLLPAAEFLGTPGAEVKPFSQHVERGLARVVYFGGSGVAGELWMDYGRPAWSDKLESEIDDPKNKRWRFGSDVWTSFESFVSMKAAGVSVPAGYYYAVLEHPAKGKWSLILLDQKEIRSKKLDAFTAAQTTGGISIPLTVGTGDAVDRLTIKLGVDEAKPKDVTLEIAFGKHRLTAPLKVDV
jgi:hypothetical protein